MKIENFNTEKIVTSFVYPPIPCRDWDWQAVFEGFEPGDAVGWGQTEQQAIENLLESMEQQ